MRTVLIAIVVTLMTGAAYAQGCQSGQVWCCKRNYSGNVECSCAYFC